MRAHPTLLLGDGASPNGRISVHSQVTGGREGGTEGEREGGREGGREEGTEGEWVIQCLETKYRIAGEFGEIFNLAVWRIAKHPPNSIMKYVPTHRILDTREGANVPKTERKQLTSCAVRGLEDCAITHHRYSAV